MAFVQSWNQPGVKACVHGFIDANTGAVYQTLPWTCRGWHGGGSSNNTHIGVEMCEPASIRYTSGANFLDQDPAATEAAVLRTYGTAVDLFAQLCRTFSLDPLGDGVILSHREGHQRGIATNHGDPEHLWSPFGLTMDIFRQAVSAALTGQAAAPASPAVPFLAGLPPTRSTFAPVREPTAPLWEPSGTRVSTPSWKPPTAKVTASGES